MSKHDTDNRSNQLNPNNDAYYQSRGYSDKDDYDDDSDGVGFISTSTYHHFPTMSLSSEREFQQRALHEDVRNDVASRMSASKAGDVLCAVIGSMFESLTLSNESTGRTLKIKVSGCEHDSTTSKKLIRRANQWLETRSWMISRCVDETQIEFEK